MLSGEMDTDGGFVFSGEVNTDGGFVFSGEMNTDGGFVFSGEMNTDGGFVSNREVIGIYMKLTWTLSSTGMSVQRTTKMYHLVCLNLCDKDRLYIIRDSRPDQNVS